MCFFYISKDESFLLQLQSQNNFPSLFMKVSCVLKTNSKISYVHCVLVDYNTKEKYEFWEKSKYLIIFPR